MDIFVIDNLDELMTYYLSGFRLSEDAEIIAVKIADECLPRPGISNCRELTPALVSEARQQYLKTRLFL